MHLSTRVLFKQLFKILKLLHEKYILFEKDKIRLVDVDLTLLVFDSNCFLTSHDHMYKLGKKKTHPAASSS